MAVRQHIGLAYLQSRPREAARVLEEQAPESVAALLADVPLRIGAPVVEEMHPAFAARCLDRLSEERQAGLLGAIGYQADAAVLRHLAAERRTALLGQLPTVRSLVVRTLLAYPEDTVGAWTNPQVISMTGDLLAGTALDRLRASGDHCPGRLFVTGPEHQLLGQVELVELLRADRQVPLESLLVPCEHILPARASLHSVLDHAAWRLQRTLPVVERGQRFAGVLEASVLASALQHGMAPDDAQARADVLASVGAGYWNVTAGILESLVALLPAGSAAYGDRR